MNAQLRYSPSLVPDDEPDYDALFDRVVSDENVWRLSLRLRTHAPWIDFKLGNDAEFCRKVADDLARFNDPYLTVLLAGDAEARRLLESAATKYVERTNIDDGAQEPDAESIDLEDAM